MTKLNSSLPKDNDKNGLNALSRKLVDNPETEHIVVAVIDCKSINTDIDTGDVEPTVRILRVEPSTTHPVPKPTRCSMPPW